MLTAKILQLERLSKSRIREEASLYSVEDYANHGRF